MYLSTINSQHLIPHTLHSKPCPRVHKVNEVRLSDNSGTVPNVWTVEGLHQQSLTCLPGDTRQTKVCLNIRAYHEFIYERSVGETKWAYLYLTVENCLYGRLYLFTQLYTFISGVHKVNEQIVVWLTQLCPIMNSLCEWNDYYVSNIIIIIKHNIYAIIGQTVKTR